MYGMVLKISDCKVIRANKIKQPNCGKTATWSEKLDHSDLLPHSDHYDPLTQFTGQIPFSGRILQNYCLPHAVQGRG